MRIRSLEKSYGTIEKQEEEEKSRLRNKILKRELGKDDTLKRVD